MKTPQPPPGSSPFGGINWILLAFVTIDALIAALSIVAIQLLGPRLPAEMRGSSMYLLVGEAMGFVVPATWIALRRQDRLRYALEVALPVGLVLSVGSGATLAWTLWANLDASTPHSLFDSIFGAAAMSAGYAAGILLAVGMRNIAVAYRLRRHDLASGERHAWFGETASDRAWRMATAWTLGVSMLPIVLVFALAARSSSGAGPVLLLAFVLLGGVWAGLIIRGARAAVSVSDSAVKVRIQGSGGQGWSVSLLEIAAVAAVQAQPEPFSFDQRKCILRRGPALAITTERGSVYVVSLEDAPGAASLINRLRARGPQSAAPVLPSGESS